MPCGGCYLGLSIASLIPASKTNDLWGLRKAGSNFDYAHGQVMWTIAAETTSCALLEQRMDQVAGGMHELNGTSDRSDFLDTVSCGASRRPRLIWATSQRKRF